MSKFKKIDWLFYGSIFFTILSILFSTISTSYDIIWYKNFWYYLTILFIVISAILNYLSNNKSNKKLNQKVDQIEELSKKHKDNLDKLTGGGSFPVAFYSGTRYAPTKETYFAVRLIGNYALNNIKVRAIKIEKYTKELMIRPHSLDVMIKDYTLIDNLKNKGNYEHELTFRGLVENDCFIFSFENNNTFWYQYLFLEKIKNNLEHIIITTNSEFEVIYFKKSRNYPTGENGYSFINKTVKVKSNEVFGYNFYKYLSKNQNAGNFE